MVNKSRFYLVMAWIVINLPTNSEDAGDAGSIPGLGRFPGEGND